MRTGRRLYLLCLSNSLLISRTLLDRNKYPLFSAGQKLSFEIIKKNLHNRRYRRLDVFQEHMFQIFEDARNKNRTDSEVILTVNN